MSAPIFHFRRSLLAVGLLVLLPTMSIGVLSCEKVRAPDHKAASSHGQALVPDAMGVVSLEKSGSTGIQGNWFADSDSGLCQKEGGHPIRDCSFFVTPDSKSKIFAPTEDLGLCAVGVSAKVVLGSNGSLDWNHIYGAQVGLLLANGGSYDALAHGVTGFSFHIDSEPSAAIRVELVTDARDNAFWGGAGAESSPVHAGYNEFRWSEVGGPIYIDNPPPFDPHRLRSIQFHVQSDPPVSRAFGFCIRELAALTN